MLPGASLDQHNIYIYIYMSKDVTNFFLYAFVLSRLDYCNSLLLF